MFQTYLDSGGTETTLMFHHVLMISFRDGIIASPETSAGLSGPRTWSEVGDDAI